MISFVSKMTTHASIVLKSKAMIYLSQAAIVEVLRLKAKYKSPDYRLRLGTRSGGCSGNLYTLQFDSEIALDDHTLSCGEVEIVVNEANLAYIDNLTLDYSEDLMGGGFRFYNPLASSSCSCGNSFSLH